MGSTIPVDIIRDGRRQTVMVTVGERPSEEELNRQLGNDEEDMMGEEEPEVNGSEAQLGMILQPLNDRIRRQLGVDADVRGVVIVGVDPNSSAAEKGLQRRDIIVSVNRVRVTTVEEVAAAIDTARRAGRSSVLMLVSRGGTEAFVGVELDR